MIKRLAKNKKIVLFITSIILILAITTAIVVPVLIQKPQDIG